MNPNQTETTRHMEPKASQLQLPKISYLAALSSWFFLPDGTLHQVGTCNTAFLYDLVELCTPAWSAEKRDTLMQAMDDDDMLGRWYVINSLCESKGVYLPMFATRDHAASLYAFLMWCNALSLLSLNRLSWVIYGIQEKCAKK